MNMEYYFSIYMVLFSCFLYSYYFKHLLLTLISLEFIMVMIFYNMFLIMVNLEIKMFLIILFLTMSVCEGALGLSLIVLIVRFYGNDYINSLSLLEW